MVQIIPITTEVALARKHVNEEDIDISDVPCNNQKRKLELEDGFNPKRVKGPIVKELGHSLLEGWWVRDRTRPRPQLLSEKGEVLPYYIVRAILSQLILKYVPLSRHSSLNELRSLVDLLKPEDIFPCVEDPDKLTYLDLQGCFGDLCDLTDSAYLKSRSSITHANPDAALQKVLAERWAYDDVSEDEPVEEEVSSVAIASPKPISEWNTSSSQTHVKESSEAIQITVTTLVQPEEVNLEGLKVDSVKIPEEYSSVEQFRDGCEKGASDFPEADVLWCDDQISNADLINHYIEVARKGSYVRLKAVEGGGGEDLL